MTVIKRQLRCASRLAATVGLVAASMGLAGFDWGASDLLQEQIGAVRDGIAQVERGLKTVDARIESEKDGLQRISVLLDQPDPDPKVLEGMFDECQLGIDWIGERTDSAYARLLMLRQWLYNLRARVDPNDTRLIREIQALFARWNDVREHDGRCDAACDALQDRYDLLWRRFQDSG